MTAASDGVFAGVSRATLVQWRSELQAAYAKRARKLTLGGDSVEYGSFKEMEIAIKEMTNAINAIDGDSTSGRGRNVVQGGRSRWQ